MRAVNIYISIHIFVYWKFACWIFSSLLLSQKIIWDTYVYQKDNTRNQVHADRFPCGMEYVTRYVQQAEVGGAISIYIL